MALTLLEIHEVHDEPGALLKRLTAACGILCRAILADPAASGNAKMWANMVKADPQAVARIVLRGVVTDPSVIALTASALRDGSAPTDAQLMSLLQSILTTFVG